MNLTLCVLLALASSLSPILSPNPPRTEPMIARRASPQKASPQDPVPKKGLRGLRPSQVPAILRFSRLGRVPLETRINLLEKAIQSSHTAGFPKSLRQVLQVQYGMLLLAGRNPTSALKTFEEVLQDLEPTQIDLLGRSLLGRGQALVALGRKKEALLALRSVQLRCPGTIYAKQAKKTRLVQEVLASRKPLGSLPRLPLRFFNLAGKKTKPRRGRLVLLIQEPLSSFLDRGPGDRWAKRFPNPSSLILAFSEDPRNLPPPLKAKIRNFEKRTSFSLLFLPTNLRAALHRLYPLQVPRTLLFSLDGRHIEAEPSPARLAAYLTALKKTR